MTLYDDLRNLKLATFNHCLAKWENANEDKPNGEISQLKNDFPVTLRWRDTFIEVRVQAGRLKLRPPT